MSYPEGQSTGAKDPANLLLRRLLTGLIALTTSVIFIIMFAGIVSYPFPAPFHDEISSPILAVELPKKEPDLCTVFGTNHPGLQTQSTSQEPCDATGAKPYDPFKTGEAVALVRANTLEDLVFIPFYALFVYCFAWLMTAPADRGGIVLTRVVGVLIFIAAMLDYLEDYGILSSLRAEDLTDDLARHTRIPSLGKWSLIGICLLLLAVILLRSSNSVYKRGTRVVFACLCIASGLLMLIGLLYPRVMILANLLFGIFVLANAVGLLCGYRWGASPRYSAVAPQQ